jgi:hypothetical protein
MMPQITLNCASQLKDLECTNKNEMISNRNTGRRIDVPNLMKRNSSSGKIRQEYFRRLGLINNSMHSSSRIASSCTKGDCIRNIRRFTYQESLNDCRQAKPMRRASTSPTTVMAFDNVRRKRSVSFSECVNVQIIAHKDMYSERIRRNLWCKPEELAQNAQRNSIEFAAENFDWRQASEDDTFFTCPDTGDKIHPAHVHWLDRVMAARVANRQHTFLQHSRLLAHHQNERNSIRL